MITRKREVGPSRQLGTEGWVHVRTLTITAGGQQYTLDECPYCHALILEDGKS